MRSTPERDARLKERLKQAVDTFAGGSADKLGRMLGYTNGGYIREILDGKKPVRAAIIERANDVDELRGWFDEAVGPAAPAGDQKPTLGQDAGPPTAPDVLFNDDGKMVVIQVKVTKPEADHLDIGEIEQLIRAFMDLPPKKARELLLQTDAQAEEYRQYSKSVLARYVKNGVISNEALGEDLPIAPIYTGPKRAEGPERRKFDLPHSDERRAVVVDDDLARARQRNTAVNRPFRAGPGLAAARKAAAKKDKGK